MSVGSGEDHSTPPKSPPSEAAQENETIQDIGLDEAEKHSFELLQLSETRSQEDDGTDSTPDTGTGPVEAISLGCGLAQQSEEIIETLDCSEAATADCESELSGEPASVNSSEIDRAPNPHESADTYEEDISYPEIVDTTGGKATNAEDDVEQNPDSNDNMVVDVAGPVTEPEPGEENGSGIKLDSDGGADADVGYNPFSMGVGNDTRPLPSSPDNGQLSEASAQYVWKQQNRIQGSNNKALDQAMQMIGLENVKNEFLNIMATIEAARQRRGSLRRQFLNLALLGNSGTGRTSLAKTYCNFLENCDKSESKTVRILKGHSFQRTSDLEELDRNLGYLSPGGLSAYAIDDIDRMDFDYSGHLLSVLSNHADKVVLVVTGSVAGTTKVLGSRPEGKWLFRRRLCLEDYDDEQLRLIFLRLIHHNNLEIDGGAEIDYLRLAAKRVGRGRGTVSFGNVHDLRIAFEKMLSRQTDRLKKAETEAKLLQNEAGTMGTDEEGDRKEKVPNHRRLTKEDIMGLEPADVRSKSIAWKELEKMAGLHSVKKEIGLMMQQAKTNYHRELRGLEPLKKSLNRVFLGPPGTGKTTVAKLYGKILAEADLLSTKEVMLTTPSDYIGQYIGESETKTVAILNSTIGKVLIIDDAHMFYNGKNTDDYRLGCIDVIVSRIHNKPGEDRCVILIGYPREMEEMFQKCNPGLLRRFPLEEAFRFEDYDDEILYEILKIKMKQEEITAEKPAMDVAKEVLRRARDRPNFGNGGTIDNLLNEAKARFRERMAREQKSQKSAAEGEGDHITEDEPPAVILEPEDFDPEWERAWMVDGKASLFDGLLGFDHIIEQFKDYQVVAAKMRQHGKDPRETIPFSFVFKGPPGTGKTRTARILGKVFYWLGFLSSDDVIECSASNLIGQYMGQTAPKVIDLFDRALGKVLFIDEAYRLGGSSSAGRARVSFEEEAVGELVDCMTKPRYLRKMVIVLAGYERDMDKLLKANAGLRGRFPTEVAFMPMEPEICLGHLQNLLADKDIEMPDKTKEKAENIEKVYRLFDKLGKTAGWSNGRDVESLAGVITTKVFRDMTPSEEETDEENTETHRLREGKEASDTNKNVPKLILSSERLIEALKDLLRQRIKGGAN